MAVEWGDGGVELKSIYCYVLYTTSKGGAASIAMMMGFGSGPLTTLAATIIKSHVNDDTP